MAGEAEIARIVFIGRLIGYQNVKSIAGGMGAWVEWLALFARRYSFILDRCGVCAILTSMR